MTSYINFLQNAFGITYQQPTLDQYVRIDSPGKLPQACSPVRRTPSSSRKRSYQFCQVTPEKQQPSIFKFVLRKVPDGEQSSAKSSAGKWKICVTEDEKDDDVKVIGETSRSGIGNMLINDSIQEIGKECAIISVQKGKLPSKEICGNNQKEITENDIRNRMKIMVERLHANNFFTENHKKIHPCTIDLTGTSHEDSKVSLEVSNEVICLENEMAVSSSIDKENRVDSSDLQVDDTIDSDEVKRDSATIFKEIKDNEKLSKEVLRTATDITRADVSSPVQNALIEESSSTKMFDVQCLLKNVSVNIGPRIDEWLCPAKAPLNKVKQSEACNLPVKEKIKETSRQMKIDNEEVKRSIAKFIRKSKRVSGIYSSDIVLINNEESKEQSNTKNFHSAELSNQECDIQASPEVRELGVEEVSFFESSIDEDVQRSSTEEQSIIVAGVDSLDLYVTPYTYPPSSLFGDFLRQLILEVRKWTRFILSFIYSLLFRDIDGVTIFIYIFLYGKI